MGPIAGQRIAHALVRFVKILMYALLCAPMALPLIWIVSGAFMGEAEAQRVLGGALGASGANGFAKWPLLPRYPTLRAHVELLLDSPEFFAMFWNSTGYAAATLAGQALVAAPAAWAFARYRFRGKAALFLIYIALMLLPFQVTLVAQYLSLDRLALLDTRRAILFPAIFSTFPVFILVKFFEAIPEEMLEAAAMDGAGPLRRFLLIGLPMGVPGLLSALVLGFFEAWGMIEQPMTLLRNPALWPISLYLPKITLTSLGKSLAASFIALLPAVLVFLYGQEYLEKGIHAMGGKE